ncbi:MBL fold metallo-hydrolase [Halomarina ordinaria]|uniref:MBL fold metallo-hydrolase n=1 Tax=Halomarina ordinaria TaxID=3033939 RepID=A0ABD5U3M3_9EURY|nr:MBL fold metallo-hydrolase [Halomarina sp. PSRA2]
MPARLSEHCWVIELRGVNAYLVADEPETDEDADTEDAERVLTLVDVGSPLDATRLAREVEATGHRIEDVERVLLTHYDIDHVGGIGRLDLRDATVYMGAPDVDYLTGTSAPAVDSPKGALQRVLAPFARTPRVDVETVADGEEVGSFVVYETPGHTAGHVAYVSDHLSAAFVGDLVVESDGDLSPSPWAISDDTEAVTESIHDLADRMPAVEILGMGHGVPFMRNGSVRLAELGERIE